MILLNAILKLSESDLENTKVRFNIKQSAGDPLFLFKNKRDELQIWQFWNGKKKSYKIGNIVIGFIRIEGNKWLLFDISRITRDLNQFHAVGYEYEKIKEYEKYCGRLIIEFENKALLTMTFSLATNM
jgi:hypothetical protein